MPSTTRYQPLSVGKQRSFDFAQDDSGGGRIRGFLPAFAQRRNSQLTRTNSGMRMGRLYFNDSAPSNSAIKAGEFEDRALEAGFE